MAIIDVTPDAERRDRVRAIRMVSVNGKKTSRSCVEFEPGETQIRLAFHWPQGGKQEVDFNFEAQRDTAYVVYYDIYPPSINQLMRPSRFDEAFAGSAEIASEMDQAGIIALPFVVLFGAGAVSERVGKTVAEEFKAAEYVDIMLVAPRSPKGIMRTMRVYPGGRIAERP